MLVTGGAGRFCAHLLAEWKILMPARADEVIVMYHVRRSRKPAAHVDPFMVGYFVHQDCLGAILRDDFTV